MIFKTKNTTYQLIDCGDGAFLISGNTRFCPVPTRVTLEKPVEIGELVWFRYLDPPPYPGNEGQLIHTTEVLEIRI